MDKVPAHILMLGTGKTGQSVCQYYAEKGAQVDTCTPFDDADWQKICDDVQSSTYDLIVVSPGIKNNRFLKSLKALKYPEVVTDIDVFVSMCSVPMIGITGTMAKQHA